MLGACVVLVLAVALIEVRKGLTRISEGLATLGGALEGVEAEHLRPLEPAVTAINAQFDIILSALPGIARKAADRRREEAAMILWWIGDVLLFVVLGVVVYLLHGVLSAATSIVPSVRKIATVAAAGSKDLDAVPLLLTTQDQVRQTVAGVANYGGSLDVILDDADEARAMSAAGVVTIIAVVLIVVALVFYLVSTIIQLRAITSGLDEVIASVTEIVEKSAPVNEVVEDINVNLDAAVDALEGLLVKKAGMIDAVGLVDGLYPGAAAAGFRNFPESATIEGAAHRRGLHQGHAHAGAPGPRGADRHGQPRRPGAAQRRGRQPGRATALPERAPERPAGPAALAGHRHRRPRPVRAARGHREASQAAAIQTRRSIVAVYRASGLKD